MALHIAILANTVTDYTAINSATHQTGMCVVLCYSKHITVTVHHFRGRSKHKKL